MRPILILIILSKKTLPGSKKKKAVCPSKNGLIKITGKSLAPPRRARTSTIRSVSLPCVLCPFVLLAHNGIDNIGIDALAITEARVRISGEEDVWSRPDGCCALEATQSCFGCILTNRQVSLLWLVLRWFEALPVRPEFFFSLSVMSQNGT